MEAEISTEQQEIKKGITVAIDGLSGAGKSTIANELAKRLGCSALDTGAMYRAVALLVLKNSVDPTEADTAAQLAEEMSLTTEDGRWFLSGEDVSAELRSTAVEEIVSIVASHKKVREELVKRQRDWVREHGGGVVEGRDITSVVLPDADLKVFLKASGDVRSSRRAKQIAQSDTESTNAETADIKEAESEVLPREIKNTNNNQGDQLRKELPSDQSGTGDESSLLSEQARLIDARDKIDQNREHSPLVAVKDALILDTGDKSVEEIIEYIMKELHNKTGILPDSTGVNLVENPPQSASVVPANVPFVKMLSYNLFRWSMVGIQKILFPGPVYGKHNIPKDGPLIIAPVHRSYIDWMIVARISRKRLRFLIKGEVWRFKFIGQALEYLGSFAVRRDAPDRDSLEMSLKVLTTAEPLVLFPEGTRCEGDEVQEIKDGTAYIALKAKAVILPVGIGGTDKALPKHAKYPKRTKVTMVIGKPIYPDDFLSDTKSGRVSRTQVSALSKVIKEQLQVVYDQARGVKPIQ